MFMSMEWDYVSELRTQKGILFFPRVLNEYGEPRWNDIDRGKPKNSEKSLSQWHFTCLHRGLKQFPL
jgi:hypothetical protein